MSLTLYSVPTGSVDSIWDKVEKFLSAGLKAGKAEYNINQLRVFLESGQWDLIIAVDDKNVAQGASAISYIHYPNSCIAHVASIGGRFIIDDNTVSQFKDLLKGKGADRIQGSVCKALERFYKRFGFERRAILVEKML